jgi:hypothetical protein
MYSHLLPVRLGFPMMLYCNQTIWDDNCN